MEELNHDLAQGSGFGDIYERRGEKNERDFLVYAHHGPHQDPSPEPSRTVFVFHNWMLSLVPGAKRKNHHSGDELTIHCVSLSVRTVTAVKCSN